MKNQIAESKTSSYKTSDHAGRLQRARLGLLKARAIATGPAAGDTRRDNLPFSAQICPRAHCNKDIPPATVSCITSDHAGRLQRARLGLSKARASATGPAAGDTWRDNASFSAQICPQGHCKEDVPPTTASCITSDHAGRLKRARLGLPKARASATGPAAGDTRRDNASFSAQICPRGRCKEDVPPMTASCITLDHAGRLKRARLGLPKARASATGPATGDTRRDNASFSAPICPRGRCKEDVPPMTASCVTLDHAGLLKRARLGLPKARASATGPAAGDTRRDNASFSAQICPRGRVKRTYLS